MWCGRKGIDCSYCGAFGECQRSACYLPIVEPSMVGAPVGLYRQHTDRKSTDDIKLEAAKEFALKIESLFAYYGDEDTFSKKVILDRIGELLKEYENE